MAGEGETKGLPGWRWRADATIALGYVLVAIPTQLVFRTVAVWPAAGVAIASAALAGPRAWRGVFVGSIVSNIVWALLHGGGLASWSGVVANLGIGAGNALAAVATALALRAAIGRREPFGRPLDAFWFCLCGTGTYALVSAGCAASVSVARTHVWAAPLTIVNWFASDLVGGIIIAPAVLLWRQRRAGLAIAERLEALAVALLVAGLSLSLFGPLLGRMPASLRLESLLLLPLFWAAVRFDLRISVTLTSLCFLLVWWGTGGGHGLYAIAADGIIRLQVLMACIGAILLIAGAEHGQRQQAVEALQGEVDQRLQAEAHLLRTNQVLRMLSASNEALVRIDDEHRLMEEVCRIAVEIGGYRMSWVGLAEDDTDRSVRPVASTGFEAGYLESARITWADTERGRGPTGAAIRLGQVQIGTDFFTDPRLAPWRAEAIKRGFRSSIALPLRQGEAVFGALTIYAAEPAAFPDAQVKVLMDLAEDLAFGIHAARVRTALRESRDRLRALAGELTLAERRERRRIAQVLHDHLQQLLVGVKFHVASLSGTDDDRISRAAKEIATLMDEALAVSRSLTAELSPPIVNGAGWTPALEWLARWMADKHGLAVALSVEPDAPAGAGDVRVLLYEAVQELLFNVVKHAQAKSASVTLRRGPGDQVQIVVADNGVGFEPATVTSAAAGGGGFGLFSIRERLDLVGGRLEVESAPGQGSRFTLTVPLGTPPGAGSSAAGAAPEPVVPPAGQGPSATRGVKIRVLVADDHPVVRRTLARMLGSEPDIQIVGEAANGERAIELTRHLCPDVVLLDVSMPGMDGIEATRRIQAECPGVQVIGLSMYDEAEKAKAMREAGAVAYLGKTCPADVVIAAIRSSLDRK
jgi:signal transduction histidine kinase/ActR/RegA family two-component response regulator